jgi:hypothetical protein
MQYVIVAALAGMLVVLVRASFGRDLVWRVLPVLILAFAARLLVHVLVMRSGVIGYGGDNYSYEQRAMDIVAYWGRAGFQFVTPDEMPELHFVAVPCHLFAIVMYLCGGTAPLACTAVVALMAGALCIVLYKFARLVGADERAAYRLLVLTAFMPAFFLHTSDTYKDGFNVLLVVSCLGLAASNIQRFDARKLLLLAPLLWALWYVRPYMVFMCALPLLFGFAGLRRAAPQVLLTFGTLLVLAVLVGVSADAPIDSMRDQLADGQSADVRHSNAMGGSGVVFDDGGNPWSALGEKLLYTLLAPFPWSAGSAVLQLGKIDVFIWYFVLYSAVRGGRRLWRQDRRMLFLLLLFIVPSTVVYATSMANVGLIFRQRMPIVMVAGILAALAWTKSSRPEKNSSGERSGPPMAHSLRSE